MNIKERILIIGASGFVGGYLFDYFKKKTSHLVYGTSHGLASPDYIQLDILSRKSIAKVFRKTQPTIVIHTAGISRITAFQKQAKKSYETNVKGSKNIVDYCARHNAKLIFLSSIFVFRPEQGKKYSETDEPDARTLYGKSKLDSEQYIIKKLQNYIILRNDLVFGFSAENKRNGLLDFLRKNKSASFSSLEMRKPLYVGDFAKAIDKLIQNNYKGILHLSGKRAISYYSLTKKLAKKVESTISISDNKQERLVPVLDTSKARKMGIEVRSLSAALLVVRRRLFI